MAADHDPQSNYGNWTYVAGVGSDPREDRYFLIPKQGREYDKEGAFCRTWVPELASAPVDALHEPWRMSTALRTSAGYPAPIVELLARRPENPHPPRAGPAARGGGAAATGGSGSGGGRHGGGGGGGRGGGRGGGDDGKAGRKEGASRKIAAALGGDGTASVHGVGGSPAVAAAPTAAASGVPVRGARAGVGVTPVGPTGTAPSAAGSGAGRVTGTAALAGRAGISDKVSRVQHL